MSKYLIVVDMQNDFIYGCLGSEAARSIIDRVVKRTSEFDGKVRFTLDTHYDNYLNTQEGKYLPVKHCIENTQGWEIIDPLKPYAVNCFKKNTFGSVELAEQLSKEKDIESIELIGVCTSICVISNAMLLKAFLPETKIIVRADCCACVSEESHKAALKAMETAQIEIVR